MPPMSKISDIGSVEEALLYVKDFLHWWSYNRVSPTAAARIDEVLNLDGILALCSTTYQIIDAITPTATSIAETL